MQYIDCPDVVRAYINRSVLRHLVAHLSSLFIRVTKRHSV